MRKLHCVSAAVLTALLMAISMFIANVGHTEYKSQVRKHKQARQEANKTAQVIKDQETIVSDV